MSDAEDNLPIQFLPNADGGTIPYRVMSATEVKVRLDLNMANTASSQRARVLAELSKTNGHSHKIND